MVGGLLYPTLYKALKRYCFTCFLIIAMIGVGGSALARSIPLFIGAGVYLVCAVFFAIYNPFPKEKYDASGK